METEEKKSENQPQTNFSKGDKVKYYDRKGGDERIGEITKIYERI